jgi:hypothetical protein
MEVVENWAEIPGAPDVQFGERRYGSQTLAE